MSILLSITKLFLEHITILPGIAARKCSLPCRSIVCYPRLRSEWTVLATALQIPLAKRANQGWSRGSSRTSEPFGGRLTMVSGSAAPGAHRTMDGSFSFALEWRRGPGGSRGPACFVTDGSPNRWPPGAVHFDPGAKRSVDQAETAMVYKRGDILGRLGRQQHGTVCLVPEEPQIVQQLADR